jgi:hypothetical protein
MNETWTKTWYSVIREGVSYVLWSIIENHTRCVAEGITREEDADAIIAAHNDAPALADALRAVRDGALYQGQMGFVSVPDSVMSKVRAALRPVPPAEGQPR